METVSEHVLSVPRKPPEVDLGRLAGIVVQHRAPAEPALSRQVVDPLDVRPSQRGQSGASQRLSRADRLDRAVVRFLARPHYLAHVEDRVGPGFLDRLGAPQLVLGPGPVREVLRGLAELIRLGPPVVAFLEDPSAQLIESSAQIGLGTRRRNSNAFLAAPFNWTLYLFYGGDIREGELAWLRKQLAELAAMPAVDEDGDRPRGLFLVTDERGNADMWQIREGTVYERAAPDLAWLGE